MMTNIKNTFIDLLRANFDLYGKEDILLSEKVLEENGLGLDTFWKITCPELQKECILKYYDSPDSPSSEFNTYIYNSSEYQTELRNFRGIQDLIQSSYSMSRYADEINRKKENSLEKISEIRLKLRKYYDHKFTVDAKILFEWKANVTKKIKSRNGIIELIEILEPEDDKHLMVFINEDYDNQITPRKDTKCWKELLEIAKNKKVESSNPRYLVNYFNTDKNNMIYKCSGYSLSQILKEKDGDISSMITIKMTTQNAISRRKNKLKNLLKSA